VLYCRGDCEARGVPNQARVALGKEMVAAQSESVLADEMHLMKKLCLLLTIAGLIITICNDDVRGDSSAVRCAGDAECFADAMRALDRGAVPSAHSLLIQITQEFPSTVWSGRASLVLGRYYQEQHDPQAVVYLLTAQRQLPILGDYGYFYLGEALFGFSEWNGAASAFDLLSSRYPDSLLRPQALYRSAEAWFQAEDCRRANERHGAFLSAYPRHALAPAILLRQGDCYQKAGERAAAIATYRRIWIHSAPTLQAGEAAFRLQAMKDKGVTIPEVSAQDLWMRGKALFDAGQHVYAAPILQEAVKNSALPDRSQALLTLGISRFRLKQYSEARPVFAEVIRNRAGTVSQEAVLWLARVYLRQRQDEPLDALARDVNTGLLSGELKAKFLLLLAAAHLDRGRVEGAISIYRQAADAAQANLTAAEALWQIGWLHYNEKRYTPALLAFEESRAIQPSGQSAAQALYWKARSFEKLGDRQKAFETFQLICNDALRSYYCQIGQARNGRVDQNSGEPAIGSPMKLPDVSASPASNLMTDGHYQRAEELQLLGWQQEAAQELLTLTPRVGQDRGTALRLAGLLSSTGEYHRALSLVRTLFADIVERGGPGIGEQFWELAYPGGYFPVIRALPENQRVDTHLITAIIREESAYNPSAISSAGALGLMQVMPLTGEKIAGQLGSQQPFRRDRLFEPCYNVRLGSWYLRHLAEKFPNNLVYVIAAYNAGPEIVSKWVQLRGDKEPDEFIESIPYTETRNYVKKVLRSYGEYKRIYPIQADQSTLTRVGERGIVRCRGGNLVE
jgi:soluble lytic murein transglycosylase